MGNFSSVQCVNLRIKRIVLYKVKEIYYTLQGEGHHVGRPAVFLRFSGCNLWTGREEDRENAICDFCDTDFRGTDGPLGGTYSASQIASLLSELWPDGAMGQPFVVCTGGEPLLQLDEILIDEIHRAGFEIAIETNGTLDAPEGLDWICVSPKAGTTVKLTTGDELKLVFPQHQIQPEDVVNWNFSYYFLQPMDGPALEENTRKTIEYCKLHPQWHLSIQSHKYIKIP